MQLEQLLARYPRQVKVSDGAEVAIERLGDDHREGLLAFARALPEDDLLFLRADITDPKVVDAWLDSVRRGDAVSLVARDEDDAVVGYATVDRNPTRWTRRVGEIRVTVGPAWRGRGLGRTLTGQIFDIARAQGLKKLMANMTTDQSGAQAAFRRLGFVPEALLADYVEDRRGQPRDLVIMSYDVDGLTDQVDEPLRV